jgi:hypothetical protein
MIFYKYKFKIKMKKLIFYNKKIFSCMAKLKKCKIIEKTK